MLKDTKMKCMVVMEKTLNKKLKEIAAKENRSVSNLVVTVLQKYIETKDK